MDNLGISLYRQGRFKESQKHATIPHSKGESWYLGPKHHDALGSKANLALVLSSQGQHNQAIAWMQEFHRGIGESWPHASRHNECTAQLGYLPVQGNEICRSWRLYCQKYLPSKRIYFGKDDAKTWHQLQFLATLLHYQNKYEEALDMVVWVLERRRDVLGVGHQDTICSSEHARELPRAYGAR